MTNESLGSPDGSEPSALTAVDAETELRQKVAHQEATIRALMAGKEEIAAELGWGEAPSSGLMAARCGRLRIEREEAQEKARLLEKLHIEEARAHQETIGWWREAMAERDALRVQLEATLRVSEFQIGDIVCWRGDRWFEGRIVGETAPEHKYLDSEVWVLEVTDPGTRYDGVDMTGRPVHVSEDCLVLVHRTPSAASTKESPEAAK